MFEKLFTKITIICLVALSFPSTGYSATEVNNKIVSGTWFELNSTVMGEKRRYAVHLPPSYDRNKDKKYPVLYLLDGGTTNMRGISGMVESLSYYDLSQQIPEFILVAIPNTNRSRDLTPTKTDLTFKGNVLDKLADNSGGADKFANFIRTELFPKINADFRTTSKRGILGMSFGGLFAAHIMITQPDMFNDYLISDATFVWDDNYLNRTLEKTQQKLSDQKIKAFIGLANNDHLGELGVTNRQWGNDFIQALKKINNKNLIVTSKYFPKEQHGTVMFLAYYYGLIDLFKQTRAAQ